MKSEEFDKKVRSALAEREIAPAPELWERLEARLDEGNVRKTTSLSYRWVAAVAVGVVFIVAIALFTPGTEMEAFPVAEQEHPALEAPQNEVPIPQEEGVSKMLVVPGEVVQTAVADVHPVESSVMEIGEVFSGYRTDHRTEAQEKVSETLAVSDTLEAAVALVVDASAEGDAYDKEVEALLAEAMKKLEQMPGERQKTVDAEALLADVEDELDRNFKDKALEVIKRKIVRLRSAVADRNE